MQARCAKSYLKINETKKLDTFRVLLRNVSGLLSRSTTYERIYCPEQKQSESLETPVGGRGPPKSVCF